MYGKEVEKGIRPKYPVMRIPFVIISVFSYVMLGFSALFFILGMVGVAVPQLIFFLPVSLSQAIAVFILLVLIRIAQLLQDVEVSTRQMTENLDKLSKK